MRGQTKKYMKYKRYELHYLTSVILRLKLGMHIFSNMKKIGAQNRAPE